MQNWAPLGGADQTKLNAILGDFRKRHDSFAAAYNELIPTISRDDVWREYRDFRVKVNDLVTETIRMLFRIAQPNCTRSSRMESVPST